MSHMPELLEFINQNKFATNFEYDGIKYTMVPSKDSDLVPLDELFEGRSFIPIRFLPDTGSTGLVAKFGIHESALQYADIVAVEIQRICEDTTVGLDANITVMGINSNNPIKAKIDTGADLCSMHATDIKFNDQTVSYTIDNRTYTSKLHKVITIARAGDEQKRPTTLFTVVIGEKKFDNVEVNLSDRSGLDTPFLLGKNLIELADIKIDPNVNEHVVFDMTHFYEVVGGVSE